MKAKNCEECSNYSKFERYLLHGIICEKGHKPRFYMDADPHKIGYKRRCEDFKAKEDNK